MTYRDVLTGLGAATEARVLAAYAAFTDGDLTEEEFVAAVAAIIAKANARAVAVADLSLAATLMLQLGKPVATLGLTPPKDDPERLQKAATTLVGLLATTPDPLARVARLGRSEPLGSAATAYSAGIRQSRLVTGWTRGVSGNACELCQSLADGGAVFPDSVEMYHHKGCTCTPIPVTKERAS